MMISELVVFDDKKIRRTLYNNEWWFSVEDIVFVLTDSANPKDYIKKIRKRDEELSKGWGQIVTPLGIDTAGGKQKVNCANVKGIFRIIQSVPSKKAEPFKQWLAHVGYERVQEIENPELAQKRMKDLYQAKGYPDDWIDKRLRGIAVRDALTDEWKARGVKEGQEYSILTAEISKATFGLTPSEYKKLKGLKRENLRDHMSDLELIFTMLGEASTTEIAQNTYARGFSENKIAAKKGGKIAGDARTQLEHESGKKVVSKENHLIVVEKNRKIDG
jgi:prophage antirepressor-like protein